MIYTSVYNDKQNTSYNEAISKCMDLVHKNNLFKDFEDGKYSMDNGVSYTISTYVAKELKDAKWESHYKMIDVQIVLDGVECMKCSNIADMKMIKDEPEIDFVTYEGEASTVLTVKSGEVAVFYPEDVHMPALRASGHSSEVRKVVFKVPVALI